MLLCFFIFDCRFSTRSGNAFAISAKHGNSDRTHKRNAAITRAGFDSFANSAATHRRAFQKSQSALDWTGGNGWPGLRHCN
jgi:hypothetical protein